MSKEEELFDDIDFNSQSDDNGVDLNDFVTGKFLEDTQEKKTTETPDEESDDATSENENDDNNNDEDADNEGIDDSEFMNDTTATDSSTSDSSVDDSSANNSSSPLQLIASTLQAEGVIDLEEGIEITSSKQIMDAVRKRIAENEFADLTEDQKTYVEALRAGIPEEDIKQNFKNLQALDTINEEGIKENEELQKALITEDLVIKGLPRNKAELMAKRSVELGESEADALEAYSSLKETESNRIKEETARLKKEKEAEIKTAKENLEKLKTTVLSTEEFITGFPTNSSTRQKVYDTMTKIVGHDKEGNPLNALAKARVENPEKMEMIESYLFEVTKGFTNFDIFKSKLKTDIYKDVDEKLRGNQTGGGTTQSVSKQNGGGLSAAIANLKI